MYVFIYIRVCQSDQGSNCEDHRQGYWHLRGRPGGPIQRIQSDKTRTTSTGLVIDKNLLYSEVKRMKVAKRISGATTMHLLSYNLLDLTLFLSVLHSLSISLSLSVFPSYSVNLTKSRSTFTSLLIRSRFRTRSGACEGNNINAWRQSGG